MGGPGTAPGLWFPWSTSWCLVQFTRKRTTTLHHCRVENQGSEKLCHLERLTQHDWAINWFQLAPRPRGGLASQVSAQLSWLGLSVRSLGTLPRVCHIPCWLGVAHS